MKAITIQECTYEVYISKEADLGFEWTANNTDIRQTHCKFLSLSYYDTKEMAQDDFTKFAKLNGITKYKFI